MTLHIHKDYAISFPTDADLRKARLVEYLKINQCNSPCPQIKREKSYHRQHGGRKGLWHVGGCSFLTKASQTRNPREWLRLGKGSDGNLPVPHSR